MKNARIVKNGTLEIDFGGAIGGPSDEIDPNNPFVRKKEEPVATIRKCKICGTGFTLHGDYDPNNPAHDLCDDCILKTPAQDQYYPEKSIQIEQAEIDKITEQDFLGPGEDLVEG